MKNTFNIVLFNPQIPPNTGNILRLCANTGTKLHIIKPIGFDLSEKSLRRAGLDYYKKVDLRIYDSLDQFLKKVSELTDKSSEIPIIIKNYQSTFIDIKDISKDIVNSLYDSDDSEDCYIHSDDI